MDVALGILQQLGADSSLLYQFIIFVVLFFVTKFLFFDRLQSVIERREQQTVGLEVAAGKQLDEVNQLADEYREKVTTAKKSARAEYEVKKNEIIRGEEAKYKTKEKEILDYIALEKKKLVEEYEAKRSDVLKSADELSGLLVEKITKG